MLMDAELSAVMASSHYPFFFFFGCQNLMIYSFMKLPLLEHQTNVTQEI